MLQVGGLLGGVKLTSSPKQLPLRVDAQELDLRPEFVQRFSDHLVSIVTVTSETDEDGVHV